MMKMRLFLVASLALNCLLPALVGCEADGRRSGTDGGISSSSDGATVGCRPGAAATVCSGNEAIECNADGSEAGRTNCASDGQVCVDGQGCAVCQPGSFRCIDNNVEKCGSDGASWAPEATCDAAMGEMCNATLGVCSTPCKDAARSNSYIGCEYWPTPTANTVAEEFDFAVVVANPQAEPANVTVTRSGSLVATETVPAGGITTIRLAWVNESKVAFTSPETFGDRPRPRSVLVADGAYRLVSTLPVTVYQFNPLEYRVARDCMDALGRCDRSSSDLLGPVCDGECFSHSNDASLLLPRHVLTGNYIAVSERTRAVRCGSQVDSAPGFVAIVGVAESPVTVDVTLAGHVASGPGVEEGLPGSTQRYTLNQGDVLQLASAGVGSSCTSGGTTPGQCDFGGSMTHCAVPDEYDLTGSRITASGPVMVLGGHACAFVPFNRFACDHIEETVFPLESWGSDFVVSVAQPLRSEPNLVRVLSGADGNAVTFDPPSAHAAVTLDRGEQIEFEARADFRVEGTGPLLVSQLLVGQNYAGGVEREGAGDPALSFAIPTEQFRSEYTFLAPETFEVSYVNVVAPEGVDVMLSSNGGAPEAVTGWSSIGNSGLRATRVEIPGGTHHITASQPFGIVVYGYGSYTSYMYPGGLNFEEINPLI